MNMNESTKESLIAWEANADFWDAKMGDESNRCHREIVRPKTELLLNVQQNDFVLDIACGNGNFSKRLVEFGATVVAFDYSSKMIENAKKRQLAYQAYIDFHVCDATNYNQIIELRKEKPYDKAVSNMAVMDIADIKPMFQAVYDLLKMDGIFVFSTLHPCFQKPSGKYLTPCVYEGEAITGQPVLQKYYHRSLQEIFSICLDCGFIVDGFFEEAKSADEDPFIIIVRLKKVKRTE